MGGLVNSFLLPQPHVHPAIKCFSNVVQDLLIAQRSYLYDSFLTWIYYLYYRRSCIKSFMISPISSWVRKFWFGTWSCASSVWLHLYWVLPLFSQFPPYKLLRKSEFLVTQQKSPDRSEKRMLQKSTEWLCGLTKGAAMDMVISGRNQDIFHLPFEMSVCSLVLCALIRIPITFWLRSAQQNK